MKRWLITGASRGLGYAFAEAALVQGDRVAALARDIHPLQSLVAGFGDAVVPVSVDIRDRSSVFAAVQRSHEALGGLDVVVNNAGRGHIGAIEEAGQSEIWTIFETNVFGPVWVVQAALPYLRAQGSGHIVQLSSIAGVTAFPMVGLYSATKSALEGISEALAEEVAPFGVHVTIVEPSSMRTEWARVSMPRGSTQLDCYASAKDARLDAMTEEYELRQPGDPARAAEALLAVVNHDNPPRRLLMGAAALQLARDAYSRRSAEWSAWEETSRSTDFATVGG